MNKYYISYKRDDMNPEYTGASIKYARSEADALMFLLKKKPDVSGLCVFKKGGTGKIIEIIQLKNNGDDRDST